MAKHTRGQGSHLGNATKISILALKPIESSDLCENTSACLDPQLKLRLIAFTLTYLSAKTRLNEAQSTDTTLVHKHEQQTLKVKYKNKGRAM